MTASIILIIYDHYAHFRELLMMHMNSPSKHEADKSQMYWTPVNCSSQHTWTPSDCTAVCLANFLGKLEEDCSLQLTITAAFRFVSEARNRSWQRGKWPHSRHLHHWIPRHWHHWSRQNRKTRSELVVSSTNLLICSRLSEMLFDFLVNQILILLCLILLIVDSNICPVRSTMVCQGL